MIRTRWTGAGMLCSAAVLSGLMIPSPSADPSGTAAVRRAPFRDVLVEQGTVTAARLRIYGSRVAGAQAKITAIVPEGTEVQPGDVLLRFDQTPFVQSRERELAGLAQAEAELLRATEDLRLEQLRTAEDIDTAALQRLAAEQGLANVLEGAGSLAVAELERAVRDAERDERRTRTTSEDVAALLAEGFATRAEAEHAEHAWRRAEEQWQFARVKLKATATFERPASVGRAKAEVQAARQGVDRTEQAVRARLAQREAVVRLAAARRQDAQARVAMAEQQIASTVVASDAHGLVVYRDLFFGSDRRKPQVGDEVFANQPLVAVPDSSELVVEARVREWDLRRLATGAAVAVRIDAYPDMSLGGTVALVGALAQEDLKQAGGRAFPLTVRITDPDPRLRPGLSARIEVEALSMANALIVPLDAVHQDDGGWFCLVQKRFRTRRLGITLRARNDLEAAVEGQLRPGERVMLAVGKP